MVVSKRVSKRVRMFTGEDLVSKPPIQDETANCRQDIGTGGAAFCPSRAASAVRRRRPIAAHRRFRSRDATAVLPPRDQRRKCVFVVSGVLRAEQHGTSTGARQRTDDARPKRAIMVAQHLLYAVGFLR